MADDSKAKLVSSAAGEEEEDEVKLVNITIKTTKKNEVVQVAADCTVKQVS